MDVKVIEQRYHPPPTFVIEVDVGLPELVVTTPVDKSKITSNLLATTVVPINP
jgi:hypothetical protein